MNIQFFASAYPKLRFPQKSCPNAEVIIKDLTERLEEIGVTCEEPKKPNYHIDGHLRSNAGREIKIKVSVSPWEDSHESNMHINAAVEMEGASDWTLDELSDYSRIIDLFHKYEPPKKEE
jgi:hypothetical protein